MYTLTLSLPVGGDLVIPVLPDKLPSKFGGRNTTADVLGLGEVVVPDKKALRRVEWDSIFPAHPTSYTTPSVPVPIDAVRAILESWDSLKPVRLILTGSDIDINRLYYIDDFSYDERGGEVGDIYYKIKLIEYVDITPRRIIIEQVEESDVPKATITDDKRAGEPEKPKTHTVASGDTLWAIAKRYTGDGNRYTAIYDANKAAIDARNQKLGKSKYTIYPGQELVIS